MIIAEQQHIEDPVARTLPPTPTSSHSNISNGSTMSAQSGSSRGSTATQHQTPLQILQQCQQLMADTVAMDGTNGISAASSSSNHVNHAYQQHPRWVSQPAPSQHAYAQNGPEVLFPPSYAYTAAAPSVPAITFWDLQQQQQQQQQHLPQQPQQQQQQQPPQEQPAQNHGSPATLHQQPMPPPPQSLLASPIMGGDKALGLQQRHHSMPDFTDPTLLQCKQEDPEDKAASSFARERRRTEGYLPSAPGHSENEEERRRMFLERNRQAALKCRQRKKQWLNNLQSEVETLSDENTRLESQATQLKEEVLNLKTLLLAHKDCPNAQANGVSPATFMRQPPHA